MKTIIYRQADALAKRPEITLQFPQLQYKNDTLSTKYAECLEEIQSILEQALLEQLRREESL